MFKISVVGDEVSQDFQSVVNFAAEFNLGAIEIRSVWNKPPQALTPRDIDQMKRVLDGTGISIVGIASPFLKCDIDDTNARNEHHGILHACIDLAKEFDANLIRTFAFWYMDDVEERWSEIVAAYDEPVKIAESEGIVLGLENEASTSLATAKMTERFVSEIDSPNVRVVWDPANEFHAEGLGETPYPDGYERLKRMMVHVHVKDSAKNSATGKIECVAIGEGVIDWQNQLRALLDDGYDGYISLETHWRPARKLDESLLNRPGGSTFSETGEVASQVCMKNLLAIIEKIR
ncbi:MAG: sugar phosphate isomerase/epimerase [Candidatus Poribacteria bacterium]|nr:sugar phosphate isomerase/epimerase [Candidatus Poribacteria bacterium]MDE0506933.1 sugar phosphate isomerase/epimerase [Candidatus Poribacteria bacterium]